jgi:hypothetical protein
LGKEDKSIVRVVKNKDNPYVIMNKEFLSDDRLSWKAKGILSYLLSKPDDWTVIVEHLIKQSKDGRDSVYAGLKELKEYCYMEKYPVKDDKGKILYWESKVYETPFTEKPDMDKKPLTEFPDKEKPYEENPILLINDINNNECNNKSDLMEFDTIDDLLRHYSDKMKLPEDRVLSVYDRVIDQYRAGNIKSFKNYFEKALVKEKEDYEINKFIDV